jgi:hypothetical protein
MQQMMSEVFGIEISEGAIANLLTRVKGMAGSLSQNFNLMSIYYSFAFTKSATGKHPSPLVGQFYGNI